MIKKERHSFVKKTCRAKTKTGSPCRNRGSSKEGYCPTHRKNTIKNKVSSRKHVKKKQKISGDQKRILAIIKERTKIQESLEFNKAFLMKKDTESFSTGILFQLEFNGYIKRIAENSFYLTQKGFNAMNGIYDE